MKKASKRTAPKATKTPGAAKTPSGADTAARAESLRILEALRYMPPRDHWPKRPRSFEWQDSQVVGFIMEQGASLADAPKIFEVARIAKGNKRAAIFFDHSNRTWRGAFWPTRMPTQRKSPGPGV